VSYLISFKFSLILLSYFCNLKQFRGDYSVTNWKQFNRFALSWILLPYPCMMITAVYFLMTDEGGVFSYPGFVAIEVILVSSILAIMGLLDALSSIRCQTVGKQQTNKQINVAGSYESDDDMDEKRKRKLRRKKKRAKEFGDGDDLVEEEE
jgi:hypothetical protein